MKASAFISKSHHSKESNSSLDSKSSNNYSHSTQSQSVSKELIPPELIVQTFQQINDYLKSIYEGYIEEIEELKK